MKLPSFSDRPLVIHRLLIGFALLLVAWSAYLQLWRGAYYHRIASSQYFRDVQQPAPRGDILDAAGRTLVRSLERRSISITPSQVRDADRYDRIACRGFADRCDAGDAKHRTDCAHAEP